MLPPFSSSPSPAPPTRLFASTCCSLQSLINTLALLCAYPLNAAHMIGIIAIAAQASSNGQSTSSSVQALNIFSFAHAAFQMIHFVSLHLPPGGSSRFLEHTLTKVHAFGWVFNLALLVAQAVVGYAQLVQQFNLGCLAGHFGGHTVALLVHLL